MGRRIAIIGAGVGAICAGVRLQQSGFDDFVMLERADGVGGTWWRNRYPGLSCDIPSHLYSFSFARKADWSRPYAGQPEILAYMQQVVDDHGLMDHVRLRTEVVGATWNDDDHTWRIVTESHGSRGELIADVLIASPGMFGELNYPDIAGVDTFTGTTFHSGAWNADHSLDGERVAVIGSAASAVQFVPVIAKVVDQLHVFQRSANWVLPKEDTPFTEEQLAAFVADPSTTDPLRDVALERIGGLKPFASDESRRVAEQAGLFNLSVVTDPELRQRLTPTVPWGCQRPLFSNDYYPTFNRDNVELVTEPISRITPTGIVTADGQQRDVDTIIFATGYETTKYISTIPITGRNGVTIDEAWSDGARAYLGISASGFPNLFMLYGPNTNHGSIIYMIECQVEYVVNMLRQMDAADVRAVDVRPQAMDDYNDQLQHDLDEVTVWDGGCHHYYRVASGRIVTQWPHAMVVYRDLTAASDTVDAYERL